MHTVIILSGCSQDGWWFRDLEFFIKFYFVYRVIYAYLNLKTSFKKSVILNAHFDCFIWLKSSLPIFALKYCDCFFFLLGNNWPPPPPRERRSGRYIGITLSGRPSIYMQIRVRPITYFCLIFAFHIWHMGVSPRDDVSRTFMILIRRWPLTSRSMYRFFDIASCSDYSFFVLWHSHIMYGKWLYQFTYFHDLCTALIFGLNIKIIFSPYICG